MGDLNLSVQLMGQDKLIDYLIQAPQQAPAALATGMYEEGQNLLREAKEQIPFRYGVAKGSGRVFPPRQENGQSVVELGFGGAASAYVAIIHENRMNRVFRNGKKSHYLEDPFNASLKGMETRLSQRVNAILRKP